MSVQTVKPKVTNLSMSDVIKGNFPDWANTNTILIQIQDTDSSPTASFANVNKRDRFLEVHQFRFDDVESPFEKHETAISDEQASGIASLLKRAYDRGLNVISHCHVGLCRSGAITECAVLLGFDDVDCNPRIPNVLVKSKIRKSLGILNSWED